MQAKAGWKCGAALNLLAMDKPCEGTREVTLHCALCPLKQEVDELVFVGRYEPEPIHEDVAEDAK
jgi:hypothetical protein